MSSRNRGENSAVRGSAIRPAQRRGGRDSGKSRPICRNSEKSPLTWAERVGFRTQRICGRLCRNITRGPWKFRRFADPPPGRFCGDGARFMGDSARRAEIRRNRHLLGPKGWNFAPHDSAADCVEISSWNPENPRWSAEPPSGRLCGEGARFREIPPDLPKFSGIATYLGGRGGFSTSRFP